MVVAGLALAAGLVVGLFLLLGEKVKTWPKRMLIRSTGRSVVEQEEPDYGTYRLKTAEALGAAAGWSGAGFGAGYLFYGNMAVSVLFAFAGVFAPSWLRRRRIRKRKEALAAQFQQALYAISSSLSAGRSVENTFAAAVQDLQLVYADPETDILQEFGRIDRKISNGISVERALEDFSRRADLEDIRQFTDVFAICKRTGGNLVEVIRRTSQVLSDKLEMKRELSVMIAQKRFESRILAGSPLAIVALLRFSSPDYMAPLYGQAAGAVLMTVCMAVIAGCWWFTGKIMDIRV